MFAILKRTYDRLVEERACTGHNHIDKLDFLAAYPEARREAFKSENIQNSFAAAGLVRVNAEHVLSKLNISLRTPTPPDSRPSSRSSVFTPRTPQNIAKLHKQSSSIKAFLKQRPNSSPSPTNPALDQLIKGCQLAMHSAVPLAKENADLRAMDERKRQKCTRSNRQIPHEGDLTVEEASQLIQQHTPGSAS